MRPEASHQFFANTNCKYYPCHKGIEDINCLFCYCPFYGWDKCPGNPRYIDKGDRRLKVCTDCCFPHRADNYERILDLLRQGRV